MSIIEASPIRETRRHPVQISVTGVANTRNTQCDYVITALCNDGSIWTLHDGADIWLRMPAIPQEENADE